VLKLNGDASFLPSEGSGGWGFLIQDSDGDVVLAGWGRVNHLLNDLQAELIACLQGVQAASNLGIGHLILEIDALMVKQAWVSYREDLSVSGVLD
jgi:ribonuclease HI